MKFNKYDYLTFLACFFLSLCLYSIANPFSLIGILIVILVILIWWLGYKSGRKIVGEKQY